MPDLSVSRQEVLARQLNKPIPVNGIQPRVPLDFQHDKQKLTVANSLFQCVIKGNVNKVRHLLSRGASLTLKNDYGFSPLVAALHVEDENKRKRMFALLLERGASYKARDERHGRTVLHWACLLGQAEQVTTLLEETAGDMNLQDKDSEGYSALHHAVRVGSRAIVDTLVDYHVRFGISVDQVDNLGLTPYLHARRLGYRDVASALKDKGLASVGHGDSLFRSPREWSQIGKFERKRAIELQTVEENNVAKILGKPQLVTSPRWAVPGIVLPSYRPSVDGRRAMRAGRKGPGIRHISVSLPSLAEACEANQNGEGRPLSAGRVGPDAESGSGEGPDKPGPPTLAFAEDQATIGQGQNTSVHGLSMTNGSGSKSSLKSSDHGSNQTRQFSTHDPSKIAGSQRTSGQPGYSHHGVPNSTLTLGGPSNAHALAYSFSGRGQGLMKGHPSPGDNLMRQGAGVTFASPGRTEPNMAALTLLEQSSFSKGKTAQHFHHSQFDTSKEAEYKHMLGNLSSIMDVLSQQQTKSFRKSVEVKKPETPPKIKKKNKVSSLAIIFGRGGRKSPKRGKHGKSPQSSASKHGGKNKGSTACKSSQSAKRKSGQAAGEKSMGKMNKLPVPTIKIN
ncbi:uncharacterized protein LOC101851370 [Aplysia californica]|uniref:Uncharacterized protein LOC101851370 n=1 Tax=Aplysia californica TaxID=6500 RepID=A0ABM1AA07_APLCA|nr:uncharacterized protein LOC101851370 [Aplysia californica]